ncbi:mechanosensitive ion channel domain-containing protein [Roseimaritima multifibrata]|uniref:mechanosensitive ion channel domain-containing protein n=1 Tax=Roseimaritima multifibrata TaxID=1930274 RepID=UPI00119FF331|nr:mechanosensitive ion channel domain-containing protein [Roseimaritima multifibrata]
MSFLLPPFFGPILRVLPCLPGQRSLTPELVLVVVALIGVNAIPTSAQSPGFPRTFSNKTLEVPALETSPNRPTFRQANNQSSSRPSIFAKQPSPFERFESEESGPPSSPATTPILDTNLWDVQPNQSVPYGLDVIETARQSAEQFRRIAAASTPVAADIANENAAYADQWVALAESHRQLSARIHETNSKYNTTTKDLEDVQAKLTQYGLTPTVGMLLRHKKDQLDAWQVQDSQTFFAGQELQNLRQKQLELEIIPFDGSDPNAQARTIFAAAGLSTTAADQAAVVTQVETLLEQRSKWLQSLQQGYQDYRHKLGELDSTTAASIKLCTRYRDLIDSHITWIPSDEPLSTNDFRKISRGTAAMLDSRHSSNLGYSITRKWQGSPGLGISLLLGMLVILLLRWRAKSWLIGIGNGNEKVMRGATADTRKVAASFLTVFVAFTIPGIFYAFASWLGSGLVSEASLQASSAFYALSLVALLIELPRQLLRNHGYVDRHVDVQLPRRQRASMYLTLTGIGLALAAYGISLSGEIDHGLWRGSLARFAFIATMLLVTWTAHLGLRPNGGFLEPLVARFGGSVLYRIRIVFYLFGIGFPIAMIALSSLGYGFTAKVLITRAIFTLVGILVSVTLWGAIKILSATAWELLTGAPASTTAGAYDEDGQITMVQPSSAAASGLLNEHFLELKHHLAFLCQCALVVAAVVSFAWLWLDIFPNARMGNPVVWTVHDTVTQSTTNAAGQVISSNVLESTPITALHLLLAAGTLFVAFQLAKLLPALFDALVLQRVSFDEGMEHFSLVLGRCLLFGVGCFFAGSWIGIRWQTIQWLAVGLAIGLGFGLQDMVRNLFGGFIVLFEKPARLGDLITVGKVTGRVAAQKLRTTVLADDEGRELIVPNKNFVSEDVVNWLGAGRLNVIPIEVAVSREERPADICRTLQELVIEQPDVLLTPAPQATLICVGKRSQRIEVRAWIEEGQEPTAYRESLLRLVTRFLRERNLLSDDQPTQPDMPETSAARMRDPFRSKSQSTRRRSA